jgi:hypothetical protein
MARTMAACLGGRAEGLPPALVPTIGEEGSAVWRLAMPAGGSAALCPVGAGAGKYTLPPLGEMRSMVAIVGTAHLYGIRMQWSAAVEDCRLEAFL